MNTGRGQAPVCRPTNVLLMEHIMLTNFYNDESGATAIEYGLIAALIAVVVIAALTLIGGNLSAKFSAVATNL